MPTVSGLGTTYNLPNYTGEILRVTPSDTPFLSAIGGLNEQGEVVASVDFEGQTQDLGEPSQPSAAEGADAPTASERTRGKWDNVTQIFQYAYAVSYTTQAARQQFAGLNIGRANPVTDELAYQAELKLAEAGRDVNWTFLNGVYNKPVDNTTNRKTRGLFSAISTNLANATASPKNGTAVASTDVITSNGHGWADGTVVGVASSTAGGLPNGVYYVRDSATNTFKLAKTSGGTAVDITADGTIVANTLTDMTETMVLDLVQAIWDVNGISTELEPTFLTGAALKRKLSKIFITDKNYQETSRNVGGINVTRIETDFGPINIMLERAVPKHYLGFAHLGICKPAYLPIPGKGYLFSEPLAKTGASEKHQLYGEIGFWHGPEQAHGLLRFAK